MWLVNFFCTLTTLVYICLADEIEFDCFFDYRAFYTCIYNKVRVNINDQPPHNSQIITQEDLYKPQ